MERVMNENNIYRAALYCRLSKDDEQAGDSVSIETQRMMLTGFCYERGIKIYEVYTDDGYSGLNFERPAFQRMLEDIDRGKVNMVVTKDLSRLGRDYIQTGYYTDIYFSQKQVRYIAINDNIDTSREDNDIAPFKNILNDMYAKDLSRKVKSAKRQRSYQGLYISAQAPYGYQVDPADHNHLIVDEEAAEVVREIFALALEGNGQQKISRILTERGITTPSVYKAQKGDTRFLRYQDRDSPSGWCYQTVGAILRDQVYTGDMVNHKSEILNYKTKQRGYVPKEDHIIVADRHEAIISREDYERAQTVISLRHRGKVHEYENVFRDLVYCAECGARLGWMMKPLKSGGKPLLRCVNHFRNPEECSHNHAVYYEELYAEVLARIQKIVRQIDSGELVKQLEKQRLKRAKKDRLASERTKITRRLGMLKNFNKKLYEDYANDLMDAKDYQELLKEYTREQKKLNARLTVIGARLDGTKDDTENVEKLKAVLDEYLNVKILTPTMLSKLIERIEVGHTVKSGGVYEQEITIYYRFIGTVE